MTLRVVCGTGHISTYNLTITPTGCFIGDKDGGAGAVWDWEKWRCKEHGCVHPEYVNHILDKEYLMVDLDDGQTKKGMMMAFLLLAMFLSRKAISGGMI